MDDGRRSDLFEERDHVAFELRLEPAILAQLIGAALIGDAAVRKYEFPAHHPAIGGRDGRRGMLKFADGIGAGNLDLAEGSQRFVEPR